MTRLLFCATLVLAGFTALGCGTSTKELPPTLNEVKPDQEKINKAIEESKSRMPGYRQQSGGLPPGGQFPDAGS